MRGEEGEAKVAIDIPTGLPEAIGFRRCDREARERLGRQWSTSGFAERGTELADALDAYAALSVAVKVERGEGAEELGEDEGDRCGVPMRMVI